jgi:hypothetical protein
MDPYLERPEIWPDFHDALVTALRGQLQPVLRPKNVARMQDRIHVVRDEQARRPDVAIVRTAGQAPVRAPTALLDVDTPPGELTPEELRWCRQRLAAAGFGTGR